ncbi:uncharacterized protein TM35_000321550 [Trypanosoma theileri]|uniref:Uncharacterized protein n=1 Tax=Trypanosoma theileri TaxID=67003 RepID=A0A1X0NNY1_9TRYP|nr:uncharacterized protein TM35_000321550 [Trypanosoma theileri]ORC85840.1 hypothetical protein TM35_000321550 [Trypanosoma theileri]
MLNEDCITARSATPYCKIPVDSLDRRCCFCLCSAHSQSQNSSEAPNVFSPQTTAGFTTSQDTQTQSEWSQFDECRYSVPPTVGCRCSCGDASTLTNSLCLTPMQEYEFGPSGTELVREQNEMSQHKSTFHPSLSFSSPFLSSEFRVNATSSAPVILCEELSLSREPLYISAPMWSSLGATAFCCNSQDSRSNARKVGLPKYNEEKREPLVSNTTTSTTNTTATAHNNNKNNNNNAGSSVAPLNSPVMLVTLQENRYRREWVGARRVEPAVTVADVLYDKVGATCKKESLGCYGLHNMTTPFLQSGPKLDTSPDVSLSSFSHTCRDSIMEPLPEGNKRSNREDWLDQGSFWAARRDAQKFALSYILERFSDDVMPLEGN